jgi:hypothetical protein
MMWLVIFDVLIFLIIFCMVLLKCLIKTNEMYKRKLKTDYWNREFVIPTKGQCIAMLILLLNLIITLVIVLW